jgi:hypothetical protein
VPAVRAAPALRRALLAVVTATLGIGAMRPAALAAPVGGKSQAGQVTRWSTETLGAVA